MLVGLLVGGVAGCSTLVRERASDVSRLLDDARAGGAKRCAPVALAIAEANAAFAELDLEQGDGERAEAHLAIARRSAREAVAASGPCAPAPPAPAAPARPADTDHDGVIDLDDRCPALVEDLDGFQDGDGCPDPDNDGDGVVDSVDTCSEPEDIDGFQDDDGCPDPDDDGDDVPDVTDKCPREAGLPDFSGCPPGDRDGDGFPDHLDRCPDEAGTSAELGCPERPTLVVLKKDRIEVREQVHFEPNQFRILPDSFGLLDQVAGVLREHPGLHIRIEGHTDDRADDAFNLTLSKQRAAAVREHLVRAGIDAARLSDEGYGERRPIAPNDTEEGRLANRRVEFVVVAPAE
jgi:outer membrane protein OmpA-like peptidoglycan-associated protein